MIIDCHGHYTTAPQALTDFRDAQKAALKDPAQTPSRDSLKISDDQIRDSLEKAQLKLQRERGSDVTIFSPRASAMEPLTPEGHVLVDGRCEQRLINAFGFVRRVGQDVDATVDGDTHASKV